MAVVWNTVVCKLSRNYQTRGLQGVSNAHSLPWILETGEEWSEFAKRNNFADAGDAVNVWPEFEPFTSIRRKHAPNGEELYAALHGNLYSVYVPEKDYIDILELNTL